MNAMRMAPKHMNWLAKLAVVFALRASLLSLAGVAVQEAPVNTENRECNTWYPSGDLNSLKLAIVLGPGNAEYYDAWDCSPEKGDCKLETAVPAGWPVAVHEAKGPWTCIWYENHSWGAGPGWMLTSRLQAMVIDPKPPLSAWTGTWTFLGAKPNRRKKESPQNSFLAIRHRQKGEELRVSGEAYYESEIDGRPIRQWAGVEGSAKPDGNSLHVTDGVCEVDMKLIGSFLVVDDNHGCGQLNARFRGFWQR